MDKMKKRRINNTHTHAETLTTHTHIINSENCLQMRGTCSYLHKEISRMFDHTVYCGLNNFILIFIFIMVAYKFTSAKKNAKEEEEYDHGDSGGNIEEEEKKKKDGKVLKTK